MSRRLVAVLSVVFLLAASSVTVVFANHSNTGIVEPLYSYPTGGAWNPVKDAKGNYPGVPLAVIVNPENGPGTCCDRNYQAGIAQLRSVGVIVLGYVYTSYCGRQIVQVESDVDAWKNLYQKNGTAGIAFDEMAYAANATCAGGLSIQVYYSTLTAYVKSDGFKFAFGNPGVDTQPGLVRSVDTVNIYEGAGLPTNATLAGSANWHAGYDKGNFSFLAYNISSAPSRADVVGRSAFVGWLYLAPGVASQNPWAQPSPYLGTLMSYLNNPSVKLSVQSISMASNQQVPGYRVMIYQPSGASCSFTCLVRAGFTPFAFNATVGWTYTLNAQSYGTCTFDHWDDATTSPFRTIVAPSPDTTYTAYYSGTC
jgi:hypothetical protein